VIGLFERSIPLEQVSALLKHDPKTAMLDKFEDWRDGVPHWLLLRLRWDACLHREGMSRSSLQVSKPARSAPLRAAVRRSAGRRGRERSATLRG
jgi:hypothetical protein